MPKNPLNLQGKSAIWRPSPEAAFALFGGALATALSAAAAGRTLGEVIGGLVAAALIGPPLAARRIGWIEQMKTMAGLVVGITEEERTIRIAAIELLEAAFQRFGRPQADILGDMSLAEQLAVRITRCPGS